MMSPHPQHGDHMSKEPKSRVVTLSVEAMKDVQAHMEEAERASGVPPSRGSITSHLVKVGRAAVLAERSKSKRGGK